MRAAMDIIWWISKRGGSSPFMRTEKSGNIVVSALRARTNFVTDMVTCSGFIAGPSSPRIRRRPGATAGVRQVCRSDRRRCQ